MKAAWLILTLLMIFNLTAVSQQGKCYQTVQLNCGDTIVDYLTLKEKRNLFKLQVRYEQLKAEVEYLREVGKVDSVQIVKLNKDFEELRYQLELSHTASDYYKSAYDNMYASNKRLTRQIRLIRAKGIMSSVLGSVGAFGAGVGVTFLILKYANN